MQADTQTNTLVAWTYSDDFVPTLYIQGEINTNGEKPVVVLKEKEPQGPVHEDLLLEFSPDVYAPGGGSSLRIKDFEMKMNKGDEYKSVTIVTKNGNIHLNVKVKTRNKNNS